MAYDGSISIDTQIDPSGFNKGTDSILNKLKQKLQNADDVIVGNLFTGVATKIFDMIVGSVDKAMDRLDTMAQFSRVMETITGSAELTARALEKVNSVVGGTAFGLDTAAAGVQSFVAAGMEVSKATDTIAAWGDAVAFYTKGTNAELATVETALQKMQTKGNVTMEHLQMLLESGIPAVQIYADAVGMSTEEVTAMMSKGELKTEGFINVMNTAFNTGTSGFPAIAGAAKEAGSSWAGSMDNMQAAITRGVASVIDNFDKMFNVKSGMVKFGKAVESVLKGIGENLDIIVPAATAATIAMAAFKVASAFSGQLGGIKTLGELKVAIQLVTESAVKGIKSIGTAIMANPIGIAITAVVALMGVIDGLSNKIDGFQKKYSDLHEEVDRQISANENLLNSLAELDDEYEKQLGHIGNVETANKGLIDRIFELQKEIQNGTVAEGEQAAAQRELIQCTQELNGSVEGLGLEYDEATNSINMSREAISQAIEAQSKYNEAAARLEHANNSINKRIELEDELYMTDIKLKRSIEELNDLQNNTPWDKGIVEMFDWGKAVKKAVDGTEELTDQQLDLTEAINGYIEKAKEEKEVNLKVLQGMNSQLETLDEVAERYGLTSEEIKNAMELKGITLDEWEEQYKSTFTDEGLSLEQLAAQWGTTGEAIKAEMDEQGISAEEWETKQEEKLEEWKNAVASKTEAVINNFKELPTSMDVSLEEMVTNLNNNAAKYQEWQSLMTQATGVLSEDVISYFNKMGTGSLKILQECLNDPSKAAEVNAAFANAVNAGVVGAEAETENMYSVGESAATQLADGASENSGEVTQVIEEAVSGGSENVIKAISEMGIGVDDEIVKMKTRAILITQGMVNGMVTAFSAIKSRMATVVVQMFAGMVNAMDNNEQNLYNKADAISANITNRFKKAFDVHSPSKVMQEIFSYLMQGAYKGMESEEDMLYGKVDDITDNVTDKFSNVAGSIYAAIGNNQRTMGIASAALATTPAGSQNAYTSNFTQIVNSPVALSPAELTREATDAQKRQKWQLP